MRSMPAVPPFPHWPPNRKSALHACPAHAVPVASSVAAPDGPATTPPFSPQGYDLSVEPDFWPPVVDTPEGQRIVTGQQDS